MKVCPSSLQLYVVLQSVELVRAKQCAVSSNGPLPPSRDENESKLTKCMRNMRNVRLQTPACSTELNQVMRVLRRRRTQVTQLACSTFVAGTMSYLI